MNKKKFVQTKISARITKIVLLLMVLIILSGVIYGVILNKPKSSKTNLDPELAVAMEYKHVQNGEENIEQLAGEDGTSKLQFDAFFLRDINGDGNAEGIRGTCREIGKQDILYMQLKIQKNCYLEDGATITINEDKNFYLETSIVKDSEVKSNYISNDTNLIRLNKIQGEKEKLLMGTVKSGNYADEQKKAEAIGENYSKENTITLSGTFVETDESGEEQKRTPFEKKIQFNIDWYGTAECEIKNLSQNGNLPDPTDEKSEKLNLRLEIGLEEAKKELQLTKAKITAQIPDLNNYEAEKVEVTNKYEKPSENIKYNYEKATKTLTIEDTAKEGNEIKTYSENYYIVKITYPMQAYDATKQDMIQLKIPVQANFEAKNNPHEEEFRNPYITDTAEETIVLTYRKNNGAGTTRDPSVHVEIGNATLDPSKKIISKEKPIKLYNGESEKEIDDTYVVKWYGYSGSEISTEKTMTFRDYNQENLNKSDQFIKDDKSEYSMENVSKTVGIYFNDATGLLGEEGEIKVYDDETGILLVTFNKDNWNRYTKELPYKFEIGVKHIKVETSKVNNDNFIEIYLVKEIDDDYIIENYQKEEFKEFKYIKTYLTAYLGNDIIDMKDSQVEYQTPQTIVEVKVSEPQLSTQKTQKEIFTIQAQYQENNNQRKWANSAFLLKMPKEIINLKINNIEINANEAEKVNIIGYEQYQQEDSIFIKILVENKEEKTFDIQINCDITPDPRITTTIKNAELYIYNEKAEQYRENVKDIYDINNNLITTEDIGKQEIELRLVSPNLLLTNQTAKEYDQKGSEVVAPQTAEIAKEQKQATLDINLVNNYKGKISNVKLIGKIPKENNTYAINGRTLGSEFNTNLVEINLPQELQEIATIYYSEKDNPDKNLINNEEEWTKTPQDYSTIKTFLIDFGEYIFNEEDEKHITYKISIEGEPQYNQISYANHAIYFSLETEQGRYKTQVEANELGFRITKKYEIELTKYQTQTQKKIPGATYYIWKEGENEGRTQVTGEEGNFTLEGLYVGATYNVKEIQCPDEYKLNEEIIKFTIKEQGDKIVLDNISSENQNINIEEKEDGEYKVKLKVEDEVKANLTITKVDKQEEPDKPIEGIRFKITGGNLPDTGKTILTDINGKTTLKGLELDCEYTLEEVKATGYYLASPIKFKITREDQNYKITITEPTEDVESIVSIGETTKESEIPTINITIQNRQMPRYNLTIKKVAKGDEATTLPGAKFKLIKDEQEIGVYETQADGTVTIKNLYAYEEKEQINQTYKLQEIYAPQGYTKLQDIEFKVTKEENGEYTLQNIQGTISKTQIEGENVTITLEDNPILEITVQDAEDEKLLPNTKFAIYNIDNGQTVPARDSKGELIGNKEVIEDKEYNVVTTNGEGKITASLPEGTYKAIQIQASEEKYKLAGTTYFRIGESQEGRIDLIEEKIYTTMKGGFSTKAITQTNDGGFIVVGSFGSDVLQLDENHNLTNIGTWREDGAIIKYKKSEIGDEYEIDWATNIGGTSYDYIASVIPTEDGGFIVGMYSDSKEIQVGNTSITKEYENYEAILIKFKPLDTEEKYAVEWTKAIEGKDGNEYIKNIIPTEDKGFIVTLDFESSEIKLDEKHTITKQGKDKDIMIVKYSKVQESTDYEVEWVKTIDGNSKDEMNKIITTEDGGFIVELKSSSTELKLDEENTIEKTTNSEEGIVVKYKEVEENQYKVDWMVKGLNAKEGSILKTTNGDYIVTNAYSIYKYTLKGELQWQIDSIERNKCCMRNS